MQKYQIVGISGTNGSGKDTVMQFLSKNYEYLFMSATDMLAAELSKRGLPLDRIHKAELSAEWRRESGYGVIVQKAYEVFEQQASTYRGLVVGSLRHPAEADAIHELGGIMIWVDADPRVRYDRIQSADRGRGVEDRISFEQFMADEEREMHRSGDAATISVADVKAKCDVTLFNENNMPELEARIRQVLHLEADV